MDKNERWAIKILLRLTSTFFVTPSYGFLMHDYKAPSLINSNFFSIICAFLLLSTYIVYLQYSIKMFYLHNSASALGIVVDTLSILSYTILATVTILSPVFHRQTWKEMFALLQEVDKDMNYDASQYPPTNRRWFLVQLFAVHIVFAFKIVWNMLVWFIYENMSAYVYYVPFDLSEYFSVISLLLMVYLNKIIRKKYAYINKLLSQYNNQERIRCIRKIYRKLGTSIHLYNTIFGYQMLFVVQTTVITVLESLYYGLRQHHHYMLISWCIICTIYALVSIDISILILQICFLSMQLSFSVLSICKRAY